jgi:four helix bundle protein
MTNNHSKIDGLRLRIRTFVFQAISFCKEIPKDEIGRIFINQLLRSSTSIGANYEEASESQSNADLIHKLSICKKEAKETKYWIELSIGLYPDLKNNGSLVVNEVTELSKIFYSIIEKRKIRH